MTEGHRPPRTRAPDTVGSAARQPTSRRGIANKAKADTQPRWRDRSRGRNVALLLDGWGDLQKDAARGVDGGTWHAYAEPRQAQVEALGEPLQQKRYRAQLRRRRDMPQGNGPARPGGIPGIADTLLQAAGASILPAISAQEVLACREGYRPGRGAGGAVRDLTVDRPYGRSGSVVEADRPGVVDHMDHAWRLKRRR